MTADSNKRPTKNERRAAAREKARIARENEKKREKRNRLLIQGGVVLGVVAILAVIALVITQSVKPVGPGPKNMASGGAIFTQDGVVKTSALADGADRVTPEVDREALPVDVSIYVDYMCPGCGAFEQEYGAMLGQYVESGDISLRVYPVNFLDRFSQGTKYSTRAANMFGCAVEQQPEHAFELHNLLLSAGVQPEENTMGLSDEELIEVAKTVGIDADSEFKQCVSDKRFSSFIDANSKIATEDGLLGLAKGAQLVDSSGTGALQPEDKPQRLVSTPTVIVNGHQWVGQRDGELEALILKYKSEIEQDSGLNGEDAAETD